MSKTIRVVRLYFPPSHSVHVQSLQGATYAESSLSEEKGYRIEYYPDRRLFRCWNARRPTGSICRVTTIPIENVTDFEAYGDEEFSEAAGSTAQ